jgi:hypothetical protein
MRCSLWESRARVCSIVGLARLGGTPLVWRARRFAPAFRQSLKGRKIRDDLPTKKERASLMTAHWVRNHSHWGAFFAKVEDDGRDRARHRTATGRRVRAACVRSMHGICAFEAVKRWNLRA